MSAHREPLVSVVMASYNCGPYVADAVGSVLAQTHRNLEVLFVDDGSTDDTSAVLARYRDDPRVHYYYQSNAGQTRAKNRGIREAKGEFVAFCDADDLWLPEKLEIQLPWFERNENIGVVYSRASQITSDGRPLPPEARVHPYASGRITENLFKSNIVPFGTAVIRRRCLDEMGCFDEQYRMGIDWELWLRLSTRYEFMFVDESTYLYRIWPGQMSRNWRGRYENAFRIMHAFLAKHPETIPPPVIRDAWADCFVQRARIRARDSHEYGSALVDLASALKWRPTSGLAWKSIAYVLSTAAGRRAAL